ncbi:hypothetical protein EVAR_66495_1 [Eumeta japonica]|uniref:Uncharacterized protein n=1 Tax=Eumeta variegata TaxID=151549 RepID=A0A4C2AIX9_EUMVA|nr:hypothetical protein EVAR_66495_1 [Eumeta japonica]
MPGGGAEFKSGPGGQYSSSTFRFLLRTRCKSSALATLIAPSRAAAVVCASAGGRAIGESADRRLVRNHVPPPTLQRRPCAYLPICGFFENIHNVFTLYPEDVYLVLRDFDINEADWYHDEESNSTKVYANNRPLATLTVYFMNENNFFQLNSGFNINSRLLDLVFSNMM